jgi:hypothetical protein
VGGCSRGRFATPADFPRHDCRPYSNVHVRRESVGFPPRTRSISCRAVPKPNVTIRDFCSTVERRYLRRDARELGALDDGELALPDELHAQALRRGQRREVAPRVTRRGRHGHRGAHAAEELSPAPERETVRETVRERERERESERETGRVAVTDTVAPTRQKSCRPHRRERQ